MIPFVEIPPVSIGPFEVHAFGALTAAGMAAGYFWLKRRVHHLGFDASHVPAMVFWMLLAGFAGAVGLKLVYFPGFWEKLLTSPGDLLRMAGIASFGGVFAGLAGGCLYFWRSGLPRKVVPFYLDALAFVFPRAWLFGRLGCTLSHDHPGIRTQSWLGVRYPGGARYDLGLLEVIFIVAYLGLLAVLDRRPRPAGFYLGLFLTTYGVFRLALDSLHENPARYFGWTVDQYASGAAFLAGLAVLGLGVYRKETPKQGTRPGRVPGRG